MSNKVLFIFSLILLVPILVLARGQGVAAKPAQAEIAQTQVSPVVPIMPEVPAAPTPAPQEQPAPQPQIQPQIEAQQPCRPCQPVQPGIIFQPQPGIIFQPQQRQPLFRLFRR